MRRRLTGIVAGTAIAALLLGACGSSGTSSGVPASQTTDAMGMTADEMARMLDTPSTTLPLALPTRADGTLDPNKIDLSGVPGVTPAEQHNAESLLRRTILTIRKWDDVNQAVADGFQSIGDGVTGEEHFLHWDWVNDGDILDPAKPEALVYRVGPDGTHTLEAVMFVLPDKYNLDNVPDVGGKLVQFHIHDNLCFTTGAAPKVAGLTTAAGTCNPPLVKVKPNVMIHVWIRPNPCGPFAALQGIGAGTIKQGQARACDHMHGGQLTL
jgi:hypothetical protein